MTNGDWQLELTRPLWLIALAALPLLLYYWRKSLVRLPGWQQAVSLLVRTLLVVLVVASLCGIDVKTACHEPFVAVAVDRSASIPAEGRRTEEAFVAELSQLLPREQFGVLPFAETPGEIDGDISGKGKLPNPLVTDIAAAIAAARAEIPADYVPRIALLTDGNQTYGDALVAANAAGVPIFTIPLPGQPNKEVYIDSIDLPAEVREGEPFPLEVVLYSTYKGEGTVKLFCGAEEIAAVHQNVAAGENRIRFHPRIVGRPEAVVTAVAEEFQDTISENNRASATVRVGPPPRTLLIESRPAASEPLAQALRKNLIDVEVRPPESLPNSLLKKGTGSELVDASAAKDSGSEVPVPLFQQAANRVEGLRDFDLLILSNIPAAALSKEQMEAVRGYVHDSGGGLIAIGGDQAFTAGGYRGTPLEDALPVISELRKERPKPSLAMVLVLDRSGSMEGESIALAKKAARTAVELLGPRDQVGVIEFEDASRWVAELRPCTDKQAVLQQIDTIAAGGGTNMLPALEKAYLALNDAFADLKHIIVLTDGLSNPGDFAVQAKRIAAAGITISTVGVGPEAAKSLLQDIADTGHGHCYLCENAQSLPKIFSLETTIAGKLGVVESPFQADAALAKDVFVDIDLPRAPTLLGYVETRAKPDGEVLMAAGDGDPLLVRQRCGSGRSAAFTSDAEIRWAAAWLKWDGFGPFWTQLARQTMRPNPAGDRLIRHPAGYPDELRTRPTHTALLKSIAKTTGGTFAATPADVVQQGEDSVPRSAPLWPLLLAIAALLLLVDVSLKRLGTSR